ncbi:spsA [Prosthecomicrobium hirschii]|uniref:SpsA n=1 Tax=Prosthecodimorpha hirschii TaxID=665126 RepID=A0A0P6W167_9HYPH|nr:glycosyltransferase family 2 protein [Prosthecomicrobium hirschii]KPL51880.1 spsA [Prosthecomicrobium hirschii]
MLDLSVVILTHNEERHILRCLEAIRPIAREVFVIDSFSTDRTVELANSAGAVVLKNKFVNYAKQFEWGLANAPITASWVMRLDADEVIEPDLIAEIETKLPTLGADVAGVNLARKHIFMGRWVRHGGRYPLILLRIWRRGQGRIEQRWMDEHMIVWGGRIVTFQGGFADHNLNDLTFFTDKHNKYATREAIDILNQKYGLFARDEDLSMESASFQASMKRFVKERIYNRLPFWVGPLGYFVYRYIFQLGFLDGRSGLIYHFLQGYWYRFLVNAKVVEYEFALRECQTTRERAEALERATGHKIALAST